MKRLKDKNMKRQRYEKTDRCKYRKVWNTLTTFWLHSDYTLTISDSYIICVYWSWYLSSFLKFYALIFDCPQCFHLNLTIEGRSLSRRSVVECFYLSTQTKSTMSCAWNRFWSSYSILGPFGPPKKHINFDIKKTSKGRILYFDSPIT